MREGGGYEGTELWMQTDVWEDTDVDEHDWRDGRDGRDWSEAEYLLASGVLSALTAALAGYVLWRLGWW